MSGAAPAVPPAVPPDAPKAVVPYVRILGLERAVRLLTELGGQRLHVAHAPHAESVLALAVGPEGALALGAAFGGSEIELPVCRPWLTRQLRQAGWTTARISRRLRVPERSVRRWLETDDGSQLGFDFAARPRAGPTAGGAQREDPRTPVRVHGRSRISH